MLRYLFNWGDTLTIVLTHDAPFWINLKFPSSTAFVLVSIAVHFSTHCDLHNVSLFVYPSSQLSSIIMSNKSAIGLFSRLPDMVVCFILSKLPIKHVMWHALLFLIDGDFSTPKFPNSPYFPHASFQMMRRRRRLGSSVSDWIRSQMQYWRI